MDLTLKKRKKGTFLVIADLTFHEQLKASKIVKQIIESFGKDKIRINNYGDIELKLKK